MRKPARVNVVGTRVLQGMVAELAAPAPQGVAIYAVEQHKGRAYCKTRCITVPMWALRDQREGYPLYYLAHELAHVADYDTRGMVDHGPAFMAHFKRLCPPQFWHYELAYKPRNAAAAGITKPKEL